MSHHLLLIIHLMAAAVWVGGHLYLSICVLPKAWKEKSATPILSFEKSYSNIGLPSLVLLVITGIWMSVQFGIYPAQWFSFSNPLERVVSIKILFLLLTVLFALSAQLRIISKLKTSNSKLTEMMIHAISVSLIGITMLIMGTFIRYGGI